MSRNIQLEHLLSAARSARDGSFGVLSTGEKLGAALVLNRFDWLQQTGYTMAEAVDWIGPEWTSLLRDAERAIRDDGLPIIED